MLIIYSLSVVAISFSPQNYTVPEGTPADIMIVLDKPSPKDITITVTTMDITAQGAFVQSDKHHSIITLCIIISKCHISWVILLSHPDPDDYTSGSFTVSIPAGSVKVTLNATTQIDNFVEDDEYFKATFSLRGTPEAVVVQSSNMAFITITDETRMLGLSFSLASCAFQISSHYATKMYCNPL